MADQMVTYTGGAHRREISKQDWVNAGVEDMDDVAWGQTLNGNQVEKADFTKAGLAALRRMPSEFRIDGEESDENAPPVKPGPHREERVSKPTPPEQIPADAK